ncbi:MAG: peptide chain release factor N(5)-glutamine methyltransferase [Dehalococcoidales bacterium]|nr:protein-(glutamine-N5) methyltransferase, release factor-specific [Dehalococcoidales bacterium]MDP6127731.1 peptide chain release factor N(5)-glutamine methyltransferase [Dehalococcoidales bacterium]MDP6501644.1 peptide chain release factor N(5)-glutamine methyltransferase [Dehalococcoidales bacterium]MDP6632884.1 peptide chain release factor N(5)-glutamine methyltransferase [Dehalococcoidales bacterium]MDP7525670.1 peptide chain release factor N(5)-glutamine methyltransferase [Dehalococcoid
MTIKQALSQASEILAANHIEDSPLESGLLLRHTLKIDRVQLYLGLDGELSSDQSREFWRLVERRLKREPTAYLTGHREFFGLDFYVDSSVLIPRPESELLVEKALEMAQNHPRASIAEIGTGSGAIAISLATKLPQARIYATDISDSALKVASFNCLKHGVENRVCLLEGDLLDPVSEPVDLIVANLPYVKESDLARMDMESFEPRLALNGGEDGLDKIQRLCRQIAGKLRPRGCLLLEIGQGQGEAVSDFLGGLFPSAGLELAPDLSRIDRVVKLTIEP